MRQFIPRKTVATEANQSATKARSPDSSDEVPYPKARRGIVYTPEWVDVLDAAYALVRIYRARGTKMPHLVTVSNLVQDVFFREALPISSLSRASAFLDSLVSFVEEIEEDITDIDVRRASRDFLAALKNAIIEFEGKDDASLTSLKLERANKAAMPEQVTEEVLARAKAGKQSTRGLRSDPDSAYEKVGRTEVKQDQRTTCDPIGELAQPTGSRWKGYTPPSRVGTKVLKAHIEKALAERFQAVAESQGSTVQELLQAFVTDTVAKCDDPKKAATLKQELMQMRSLAQRLLRTL